MELSKLRQDIDAIDNNIKKLLEDRFELSSKVGTSKIEQGSKVIYRKDREDEILDKLSLGLSEDVARSVREIYKNIMVNSRKIQYEMIAKSCTDILDNLDIHNSEDIVIDNVVCQGIEGAYSHIAARKLTDKNIIFKETFRDVFLAISGRNIGILPLDNSTQGMVSEVYDLLLNHGFYIIKSIDLPISHVAMAKKGTDRSKLKYVTAHPQALAQCSNYIEKVGLIKVDAINNAVAVKDVATSDRDDIIALGDRSNALRYDLEIIDEDITNSKVNTTRFIVVADKMYVPRSGGKVSIVFSTENSSGTLANVLNIIASYGVSMSKIESRPIADDKWEYRFYIDLEGNIRDEKMRALIFELESELPFLKVLGSYDEL